MPPVGHVVMAFVIQIKRMLFYARVNREKLALSRLFYFFIPWMSHTYRTRDVFSTFLYSVKLVCYLIELKLTHRGITEVLGTCVHISLYIRKIIS